MSPVREVRHKENMQSPHKAWEPARKKTSCCETVMHTVSPLGQKSANKTIIPGVHPKLPGVHTTKKGCSPGSDLSNHDK